MVGPKWTPHCAQTGEKCSLGTEVLRYNGSWNKKILRIFATDKSYTFIKKTQVIVPLRFKYEVKRR